MTYLIWMCVYSMVYKRQELRYKNKDAEFLFKDFDEF